MTIYQRLQNLFLKSGRFSENSAAKMWTFVCFKGSFLDFFRTAKIQKCKTMTSLIQRIMLLFASKISEALNFSPVENMTNKSDEYNEMSGKLSFC